MKNGCLAANFLSLSDMENVQRLSHCVGVELQVIGNSKNGAPIVFRMKI